MNFVKNVFIKNCPRIQVEYYFASVKWVQKNVSSLKNNFTLNKNMFNFFL